MSQDNAPQGFPLFPQSAPPPMVDAELVNRTASKMSRVLSKLLFLTDNFKVKPDEMSKLRYRSTLIACTEFSTIGAAFTDMGCPVVPDAFLRLAGVEGADYINDVLISHGKDADDDNEMIELRNQMRKHRGEMPPAKVGAAK